MPIFQFMLYSSSDIVFQYSFLSVEFQFHPVRAFDHRCFPIETFLLKMSKCQKNREFSGSTLVDTSDTAARLSGCVEHVQQPRGVHIKFQLSDSMIVTAQQRA